MNYSAFLLVVAALPAAVANGQTPVYRVNCGGPATNAAGVLFHADGEYTSKTGVGFVGVDSTTVVAISRSAIGWLAAPFKPVHGTSRTGFDAYRFDVEPGDYIVRLHFSELGMTNQGPGLRVFSLNLEGQPAVVDFDISATVGWNFAVERSFAVTVTDGVLDIEDPNAVDGLSALSAVEVFLAPKIYPGPAPVTGFAAKAGFNENILTWESNTDPNIRRFQVERSIDVNGPWLALGEPFHGPPRYIDRSALAGEEYFYRVMAEDHGGQLGPASPIIASTAVGLDASPLRLYELTVAPEDLVELSINPFLNDEVPATLVYNGASYDVEVRYRGGASRRESKKGWKVKFDSPEFFEGRREFNLKAQFIDSSMIREASIKRMQEYANLSAAKIQPIRLMVNGVFMGVYDQIEQVDDHFLAARGRSAGDIFRAESDLRVLDTEALYRTHYDKKTNEDTGHDELIDLIELINDPAMTLPELADRFDLDNYLNFLATSIVLADADQIEKNYFLFHDLELGRWEWIVWDNDVAMLIPALPLDWGTQGDPPVTTRYNRLLNWVYGNDALRWRLAEKIEVLLRSEATPAVLGGEVNQAFAEISEDARRDIFKNGWALDTLFVQGLALIMDFIDARSAFIKIELPGIRPATAPSLIWINEFMALNESTLEDPFGEFDGWIELFNGTQVEVDLGGMYLTNDIGNPVRWQIPTGTMIPARGRLLIWAGGSNPPGPLHANFELDGLGGEIALFDADGTTLLDFYHYRPQFPDVSEGRISDGKQWFKMLATPTPGSPNQVFGALPPRITFVTQNIRHPGSSNPVKITCLIESDNAPVTAQLNYSVDNGVFTAMPMTPLENNLFEVTIPPMPAGSNVAYYVKAADASSSIQSYPLRAPDEVEGYSVIANNRGLLFVNEFAADNDGILQDPAGDFEDYIEIYNAGALDFNLSNTYLTDDLVEPLKWRFPAGTTVAAGTNLLVWADGDSDGMNLHTNFSLRKSGEAIGVYEFIDGTVTRLDELRFQQQESDIPMGRMADGGPYIYRLLNPTPGASNRPPEGVSHGYQDKGESNAFTLSVVGTFQTGSTVTFEVDGAAPNATGYLLHSLDPDNRNVNGGISLISAKSTQIPFATDANGDSTIDVDLSTVSRRAGTTIYAQSVILDQGWSQAVTLTIAQ